MFAFLALGDLYYAVKVLLPSLAFFVDSLYLCVRRVLGALVAQWLGVLVPLHVLDGDYKSERLAAPGGPNHQRDLRVNAHHSEQ